MFKNILKCLVILLLFFSFSCSEVTAATTPEKEIRTLLINHNKALEKNDIETIKNCYTSDYKSADGFDLPSLVDMIKKTNATYGNMKYKTKISDIMIFDNYAVAQVTDITNAMIFHDKDKKDTAKAGHLTGKSAYAVFLKKTSNGWKIFYDDILMEETSLKYGIANKLDINLTAPVFIKEGEEYDLSLKVNKPNDIIALASISNEEIVYPAREPDEQFRKLSIDNDLERIVRANKKNLDEYAVATVGFTRVSLNKDETKARIEILGMAYILKRINMQNQKVAHDKI